MAIRITCIMKLLTSQFYSVVSCATSFGVYISQLVSFDRASTDITCGDYLVITKLPLNGCWYHKLDKTVSVFIAAIRD